MNTIKTLLQSFEDYSSKFTNQELYTFTEGGIEPSLIKRNPPVSEDELNQFIKKMDGTFPLIYGSFTFCTMEVSYSNIHITVEERIFSL